MNTEFDRHGLFARAVAFSAYAHDNMTRPGTGLPSIMHAMEAASIAATITNDPEVLSAAVLHDVIEDCGVTEAELRLKFGKRVAFLVSAATEEKFFGGTGASGGTGPSGDTGSWQRRKLYTINSLRAAGRDQMIITLSDKLSNLRAIRKDISAYGGKVWQTFNQPNQSMHKWYYTSILQGLEPLNNLEAYQEYKATMDEIFG